MTTTESKSLVRPSTDGDIPAIAQIYDHHVRHGIASFETDPLTPTRWHAIDSKSCNGFYGG
jgi:L-amino acid N-acyltransferase YncA